MSEHQQENSVRIANYLDNKLSPEGKEAFKKALGEDDELRLQYVEALMSRARMGSNTGGTVGGAGGAGNLGEKGDAHEAAEDRSAPTGGGNAPGPGGMENVGMGTDIGGREDAKEMPGSSDEQVHMESPAEIVQGETAAEKTRMEAAGETARMEAANETARMENVHEGVRMETPDDAIKMEAPDEPDQGESGIRENDREGEVGWGDGEKKGSWFGRGGMVAATLLLIVAVPVAYFLITRRDSNFGVGKDSTAAVAGNGADTVAGRAVAASAAADSGKAGGTTGTAAGARENDGAAAAKADSVYKRLYKPYMRGDDPLELRKYYRDYKKGNYAAVLAVEDSVVMGVGQQRLVLKDYMRLYKGLAYVATDDARDAVTELEGVVLRTKPGDILYETARWYLALAWLKRTDVDAATSVDKAIGLSRDIEHSYSRYSQPARELIQAFR